MMGQDIVRQVYVVAGVKPWSRRVFRETIIDFPGEWHYIDDPAKLTPYFVQDLDPRYLFFLHWSKIVPKEIVERYECVCFHMTDVPFGRGGSPLQNLIIRGHRSTMLTALRMVGEVDAGPVYLKRHLSLEGSAEEIYLRTTRVSAEMIEHMIHEEPEPTPQDGKVVEFRRRTPSESRIMECSSLLELFDFLRMLDAEGYPRAYIEHEGFIYKFHRACLYDGRIDASVTITPIDRE